jgi:hypothetical protein
VVTLEAVLGICVLLILPFLTGSARAQAGDGAVPTTDGTILAPGLVLVASLAAICRGRIGGDRYRATDARTGKLTARVSSPGRERPPSASTWVSRGGEMARNRRIIGV